MQGMDLAQAYINSALDQFHSAKRLGEKTFEQVSDEDLYWKPHAEANSIAILIQHMHGNMISRWTNFLTTDGEKESRQRDAEFEEQKFKREELVRLWEEGWKLALKTVGDLSAEDLMSTITIRSEPWQVIAAVNRQVAHYNYHAGQIVELGRQLAGTKWVSLSVPRGKSDEYTANLKRQHQSST